MKQPLQTKSLFAALLLFLVTLGASAQLSVTATVTNEGCPGTGALAFVLGGSVPGATVSYQVTDADGNISNVTGSALLNLTAGTYTIVATQTVQLPGGPVTTTATTTAVINPTALTPQPSYGAVAIPASCPGTGQITMDILIGSPTGLTYEIISGPTTRPQQAGPVFAGLDAGTYVVRMTDFCGRQTDVTVIVSTAVTAINVLAGTDLNPPVPLPDCDHILRLHTIPAFTSLNYPLTFTYTVTDPSGNVLPSFDQVFTSGPAVPPAQFVTPPIPFFEGEIYSYQVVITDRCGNVIGTRNTIVDEEFTAEGVPNFGRCKALIDVTLGNTSATGPFRVNFISFPAGFDPVVANAQHPLFTSPAFSYGNQIPYYLPGGDITVPNGNYVFEVTDMACPDHGTETVSVEILRILPYEMDFEQITPCGGPGTVIGTVVNPAPGITFWNQTLPNAIMITASNPPLPANQLNRTGDINPMNPSQFITTLPLGTYTFTCTDECGNTLVKQVVVAPNQGGAVLVNNQRPGCGEGDGSLMILDENFLLGITGAEIVDGPPTWRAANPVTPVNIDANVGPNGLNPDALFINSLPEGDYVFNITDVCGTQEYRTTVQGYHFTERTAVVNRDGACNSFTVTINDVGGNNDTRAVYYLQKEVSPGVWGHPQNGTVYVPGTALNNTNAINFSDPAFSGGVGGITTNLATFDVTGTSSSITAVNSPNIRVVQVFNVYGNGTLNERCVNEVNRFDYTGAPVLQVYPGTCATGGNEVVLVGQGVAVTNPLRYSITAPVATPEQTTNIFTGLADGTYTFQVRDDCGTGNQTITITQGQALAIVQNGTCPGTAISLDVNNPYPFLDYSWHLQGSTVELSNTGSLPINPYDPAADNGVYEVDVTFALNPLSCFNQTLTYTLTDTPINAGADNLTVPAVCSGTVGLPIALTNYLSADAQSGGTFAAVTALPAGVTVTPAGDLDITTLTTGGVFDFSYTLTSACGNDDATIRITVTETPALPTVNVLPIQCTGNSFTLTATSTTPGVVYTWVLPNNGATNVTVTDNVLDVTNAELINGATYEVYATSADGLCSSARVSVPVTVTTAPNAGVGQTVSSCNPVSGELLQLETATYLGTTFDSNGDWTDTSATPVPASQFNIATGELNTLNLFGTYTFRYEVTACGTTVSTVVTLNLNATPATPVITPATLIVCAGGTVQVDTPAVTGATYVWTLPDGITTVNTGTAPQLVINNADPAIHNGSYSLTVSVNNCPSIAGTTSVTVTPLPAAGLDGGNSFCSNATGTTETLTSYLGAAFDTAATPNIASAVWTLVSASTPLTTEFDAVNGTFTTANLVGTYVFKYTVTSDCGAIDDADVTIILNATPAVPVATATATTICETDGTLQLDTTPVAGATYSWRGPNGFTSSLQNPVISNVTLAAAGDYYVTVTTTGPCSTESPALAVTVTPKPQFTLSPDVIVCPTQQTTITVTPSNGSFVVGDPNISYTWTADGVPQPQHTGNSITVSTTVDVTYEVVVTNSNGGCSSLTKDVDLTIDTDPFTVVLQSDCVGDHLVLSIANIDEIGATQSIVWSGGASQSGNSAELDITAANGVKGEYTVVVTNANGCVKEQTVDIQSLHCMIPKGISPDTVDQKNDFFDLTNLKVENLQIFNRYGLQVYEKNNYTKEWFGQSDKGDLPTGTYFYVAKLPGKQVTGWVYIQRTSN